MVRYDQNLLKDIPFFLKKKIFSYYKTNEKIIEIGPGKGIFSFQLSKITKNLIVLEIDSSFCTLLKGKGLNVVEGDFLNYFKEETNKNFVLFSSLPYSQLKRLFCSNIFFRGLFIGPYYLTKKKGCFSNYLRFCYDIKKICDVPKELFDPVPKIKSIFFEISRKKKFNYSSFKKIFKNPGKKIKNQILTSGKIAEKRLHELNEEQIKKIIENLDIF